MPAECDRCGLCCTKLIVEIEHLDVVREPRLAVAHEMNTNLARDDDFTDWDRVYLLACGKSLPCPFLGPENACQIYPTRPNCCVGFEAGSEECNELRVGAGLQPLTG